MPGLTGVGGRINEAMGFSRFNAYCIGPYYLSIILTLEIVGRDPNMRSRKKEQPPTVLEAGGWAPTILWINLLE